MNLLPNRCHLRFFTGFLIALWLPAMPLAAAPAAPGATTAAALAAQIDAQIGQPRFAAASWGIAVVSLDSGRALYTHRADRLLQPASTAKLFTAALGLSALGPDYRIPTRLLGSGDIRGDRLHGDLVLYGMGDPTLGTPGSNTDWADQLASQLAAHGIRHVHGDLVADDSYFRGPLAGSGWEANDLQSWFAVPASALSVQENIVTVTVAPGMAVGRPAIIGLDPPDTGMLLKHQLSTTARNTHSDINLYRAPGSNTLSAFGNIAERSPAQHFRLAVTDPAQLAGRQLLQALARRHIRLDGKLRVLHWPQDDAKLLERATVLGEVRSPPLGDMLQRGLKRSQNLYLQNLLLSVGVQAQAAATSTGFVSTESRGIEALHDWLARIGIAPSSSLIAEGSGLARRNLATPNALVRLLTYMAVQPYAATWRDALPIAGVDGTLAWRMRHTAAANNVHAKTGSMDYVQCLAGYVTTAAGERLAFAIMLNNYDRAAGAPSASHDLDALAVLLAEYRGRD